MPPTQPEHILGNETQPNDSKASWKLIRTFIIGFGTVIILGLYAHYNHHIEDRSAKLWFGVLLIATALSLFGFWRTARHSLNWFANSAIFVTSLVDLTCGTYFILSAEKVVSYNLHFH